MRNLLLILLLSTVTGWATAAPQGTAKAAPDQLLERLIGTSDIGDALPLTTAGGLVAFSADSKLYIMSANGRFLIDGRVRDLWHNGRTLNSMADIERYALRLDLDALGLDFDQLVTVRVGHGAKKATLLVAPGCPACVRAIDAVRALGDTYTTRIVVVPRVNQVGLVQRIDCAADGARKRALLDQLSEAKSDADPAAPVGQACVGSKVRLTSTLMAARLIGAAHVPFIINPQGEVSKGLPQNRTVAAFLAGQED